MAQSYFPLSTVITVSLTGGTPGFAGFNTGNLAIFTDEPYAESFPSAGIQYYQGTQQVGLDFGTTSRTYAEAVAVFSQNPNILAANGQLIIIAMKTAQVALTFDGVPASGSWVFNWGGNATSAIEWNATATAIQTAIQDLPGLECVTVSGTQAGELLTLTMWGVYGESPTLPTITSNTLETSGSSAISITPSVSVEGESIVNCLTRTQNLAAYAAVIPNETYETIGESDFNAAATAFQALRIFWGVVGTVEDENASPSGVFYENMESGNTQTRTLTYLNDSENLPLSFLAGYMSRLMSVNYSGSNTKLTMNGKQLNGVLVDSVITPGTDYNDAAAAGSDIYISIAGDPFVISNGANLFADQVTGRLWLQGAIQTAYFNLLAQTSTEIDMSQDGLNTIAAALKAVMQQGVTNGYIADGGTWNLPDTFGNIQNFYANISNYGYYIYVPPASQETIEEQTTRTAPLFQIAYIENTPVQKASVMLLVEP